MWNREILNDLVDNAIKKHENILLRKYRQTHYTDEYENVIENGWDKEVKYFINSVIQPSKNHVSITSEDYSMIKRKIFLHLNNIMEKYTDEEETTKIATGIDYENYIEKILKNNGFKVNRTPTTGDQGVDLVAIRNGKRIAIQCKYYSKPVGNKAVQEVVAGKDYYECEYACVVSNNTFTPAARKLAAISYVLLLNEDDIAEELSKLVRRNIKASKHTGGRRKNKNEDDEELFFTDLTDEGDPLRM